jgi:aspartyl aminopeptidase
MAEKKSKAELLREQLCYQPKNSGLLLSDEQFEKAENFCEGYKGFLNASKTERETAQTVIAAAKGKGFSEFERTRRYRPGDRFYFNNQNRAIILCTMGSEGLEKGLRIVASHIDAPRIDLKPRPLYEDAGLALFKTHYYGGIKKYQWTAIPLALHGVFAMRDQTLVHVTIGEDEKDPVFTITDLLPHLAEEQMKRKLSDGIRGEELNVLVGGKMFRDDKASERVKLAVLKIFFEKYGITESDFLSAELSLVPAFKASDVGIDRSFIGAYGHDDRVSAYTSMMAGFDIAAPKHTSLVILADKEETGSDTSAGLNSRFLEYFVEDLAAPFDIPARTVLANSLCLSADVNAAYDPTFGDVHEKSNAAYANLGVVVTKYTGSRGKSSTNDASAETMGYVRAILDEAGVQWQAGELGKVDIGGGGTVAKYISALGVRTIDVGVPVLSMHAPFEVVSKSDVYQAYRAFCVFLK